MSKNEKMGFLNLLILTLSVYILGSLLFSTFVNVDPETLKILQIIDDCICVIFLIDFFYRLYKSENRSTFFFKEWGWLDLISSIPTFDFLRAGRVLRIIRLIRIIRAFRSVKLLYSHVFKSKVEGTFTTIGIYSILLIIFSSLSIIYLEDTEEANIKTAEDSIWWAFTTFTSCGYGDVYPVTSEGRVLASILMISGYAMFGTFMGYVGSIFSKEKEAETTEG